jgi:transketolase
MKKELLEYSYQQQLSHIPSALSMLDYVDVLFTDGIVKPYKDHIVIGKPFGSQAYYLVWRKLGYLGAIEDLSVGVKHDELLFVDYGEETMGNALGVAIGIALADPGQRVWVNITDATLQMGNTLEALQFIGHHQISNIFVTVDYNNAQVTGTVSDVLKVNPVKDFCRHYHWWVQEVNGHDKQKLGQAFANLVDNIPNIVFCKTQKGHGVKSMTEDIKKWHYKKIETSIELQSLVAELAAT